MAKSSIYLDYAAATPMDARVLKAMLPYYEERFYNPSATYAAAKNINQDLEAARKTIAARLGARSNGVIFTAGGTEANNLAIHGIMRQFPGSKIVISAIEHESVLAPAREYDCQIVPVKPDGLIDLIALEKAIDSQTALVSIVYANNEIGTIQPLNKISQIIKKLNDQRKQTGNKLPLYFHSDACQAANYLDMHVSRLGVDLLTINGGKLYGPKQSGALFAHSSVILKPLLQGGGQELGRRSGTENVAQSIGLAWAFEFAQAIHLGEARRLRQLQLDFLNLIKEKLPQAIINGSIKNRLPNNLHITIPGQDNERLLFQLDESGILAAAGSACSASDVEPSHVLRAIGLTDPAARASLRFSMGQQTSHSDVLRTVKTLASLVA